MVLFYDFYAFQTSFSVLPGIQHMGCLQKSSQAVSPGKPLLLLANIFVSSPLFLSSHFLTASNPLLIKVTICYLLYIVCLNFRTAQRVVISILFLYRRKLTLGEIR